MSELLLAFFREKYDSQNRVTILRSSKDAGLAQYLERMEVFGATHMEPDGRVYVKIHDLGGATRGTWLEELAHALQYLRRGNIDLSVDNTDRRRNEIEVASCLLNNASRLCLSKEDIRQCKLTISVYEGVN